MKRIAVLALMLLSCSFVCCGAEIPVPEKVIGAKTIAVISLNLEEIKKDALLKSITTVVGEAPDAAAIKQFDDLEAKIKASGATSLSFVLSIPKGSDIAKSSDNSILVVEMKEGADNTKVADLLYELIPGIKTEKADDCPKEIEGALVWYKKGNKLPAANKERADAFSGAYGQVGEHQSISIVLMPDEDAVESAKASLKPEEKELVSAILDGDGILLFSNLGVSAEPSVKLLIMAADAAGAEKLTKAAQALIDQFKKELPPPMAPLMDTLKLVQAGTNVQLSLAFPEITKAAKDLMAAMAPPPAAK